MDGHVGVTMHLSLVFNGFHFECLSYGYLISRV